jgi:hypothetical protein
MNYLADLADLADRLFNGALRLSQIARISRMDYLTGLRALADLADLADRVFNGA